MKILRKLLLSALAVMMSMVLFVPAFAAETPVPEDVTYTVRVYAGAQGTVNNGAVQVTDKLGKAVTGVTVSASSDGSVVTVSGVHYGDLLALRQAGTKLNNDVKYYVYGFRESGKDSKEVDDAEYQSKNKPAFTVTEDRDFVVSYAMLGSSVEYTVRYIDAEGNRLASDEVYYGNVGDKPVLAFLYIEGYIPQAYNLTGELDKDPAKNVFTFIYTPIDDSEEEVEIKVPGTGTGDDKDKESTDGSKSSDESSDESKDGEGDEDDEEEETVIVIVTTEDEGETVNPSDASDDASESAESDDDSDDADADGDKDPQDIEDINDNKNPLSQFGQAIQHAVEDMTENLSELAEKVKVLPTAAKFGLIAAAVLLVGGLIWLILFLIFKKKKKKDKEKVNE